MFSDSYGEKKAVYLTDVLDWVFEVPQSVHNSGIDFFKALDAGRAKIKKFVNA